MAFIFLSRSLHLVQISGLASLFKHDFPVWMIMTGSQPSCIKTWKLSDLIFVNHRWFQFILSYFISLNLSQQWGGLLSHTLMALRSLPSGCRAELFTPCPTRTLSHSSWNPQSELSLGEAWLWSCQSNARIHLVRKETTDRKYILSFSPKIPLFCDFKCKPCSSDVFQSP